MNNNSNKARRLNFSITNVLSNAWHQLEELNDNDRSVVNTQVVLLLLLITIATALTIFFHENILVVVVATMLSSIAIAIIFLIFDRLSVLTPIHASIEKVLADAENSSEMRAARNERLIEKFFEVTRNVDWYNKYSVARHTFGLNAVGGIEVIRKPGMSNSTFKKSNIFEDVLGRAERDDSIKYLTSFIDSDTDFISAVQEAVRVGAHVQVMLMMPREDAEVVVSRWKDFYDGQHKTCAEFVEYIRPLARRILSVRNLLRSKYPPGSGHGSLEVRFYTKSLNFPLIVTSAGSRTGTAGEAAYTGFYANRNAEEMPYIEWRGGDFGIVTIFKDMFDAKWNECQSLTEI